MVVVGESAFTPSWTVGKEPGVNGSDPSTMIAPAGAEVWTHGGAEEVVEDTTLLEEEIDDELEVITGAEEDVEVVEAGVLMQEHPLEIFEGKFEQADAHVGSTTELVARV